MLFIRKEDSHTMETRFILIDLELPGFRTNHRINLFIIILLKYSIYGLIFQIRKFPFNPIDIILATR